MKINLFGTELLTAFKIDKNSLLKKLQKSAGRVSLKRHSSPKIDVIFVDPAYIKNLKKKYLGASEVTDVVAFPFREKKMLGEIYICPVQVFKNSREYQQKFEEELIRVFIHGLLHLIGYRDDGAKNSKVMWREQEAILRKVL